MWQLSQIAAAWRLLMAWTDAAVRPCPTAAVTWHVFFNPLPKQVVFILSHCFKWKSPVGGSYWTALRATSTPVLLGCACPSSVFFKGNIFSLLTPANQYSHSSLSGWMQRSFFLLLVFFFFCALFEISVPVLECLPLCLDSPRAVLSLILGPLMCAVFGDAAASEVWCLSPGESPRRPFPIGLLVWTKPLFQLDESPQWAATFSRGRGVE